MSLEIFWWKYSQTYAMEIINIIKCVVFYLSRMLGYVVYLSELANLLQTTYIDV